MQTLIEALRSQFKEWPEGDKFFTCDPDGEIRGTLVSTDFYPSVPVYEYERAKEIGSEDGTVVTKEMFETN